MDVFIHYSVFVHALVQLNASSFFRSLHIGAALVAKSWNIFDSQLLEKNI
jgi:hypothetical protein